MLKVHILKYKIKIELKHAWSIKDKCILCVS